jgi:hypothetical protein
VSQERMEVIFRTEKRENPNKYTKLVLAIGTASLLGLGLVGCNKTVPEPIGHIDSIKADNDPSTCIYEVPGPPVFSHQGGADMGIVHMVIAGDVYDKYQTDRHIGRHDYGEKNYDEKLKNSIEKSVWDALNRSNGDIAINNIVWPGNEVPLSGSDIVCQSGIPEIKNA